MKRIFYLIFLLMIGTGPSWAQPTYSVTPGTGGNAIPFGGGTWADQRCQFLYLAGEFGPVPSGMAINKIYFQASSAGSATLTNLRIDMGQNLTTTTLSTAGWIPGLSTVLNEPTYTIPSVAAGDWFVFELTTPMPYDPSQHLIVDTRQSATSGGITLRNGSPPSGNRRAYGASAAASPSGSSTTWYNFGFDLIALECKGTPVTELEAPDKVCVDKPFTITLENIAMYANLEFKWETSLDGVNWVTDTTKGNHFNDALKAPKWYRCEVLCVNSGQRHLTKPVYVAIAPFYYCYCDGSFALSEPGVDIGNVQILRWPSGESVIDNGDPNPFLNNPSSNQVYSDFRDSIPIGVMYRDSVFTLRLSQINSGSFTPASAAVYIDWNRNGRFDTSEKVTLGTTTQVLPEPGVLRDTFAIPSDAEIGITGMRVIMHSGSGIDPDTCMPYGNGETEDYLVDIRYEPCTGPADPGVVVATDTSMCVGYSYSIADTTYEFVRSRLNRFWQHSPDSVVWSDIPNSTGVDEFKDLIFTNTIYYRMVMVCESTQDTTYSAGRKIEKKPGYKCYCHSQAIGNAKDSSDIGAVRIGDFEMNTGGPHTLNKLANRPRTDYTDEGPIELLTSKFHPLMVYHTMPGEHHADSRVTVFIDFNNNRKYDIPQERVGTWFTSINDHTITDSLWIPDSVIVGVPTGMRIILNNNVGPNSPSDDACGYYTSGETEDYMVIFRREFPKSINTVNQLEQMQIFPNPTKDRVRVRFLSREATPVHLTVTTITGKKILEHSYQQEPGYFDEEISLQGYPTGLYLLRLEWEGGQSVHKLSLE